MVRCIVLIVTFFLLSGCATSSSYITPGSNAYYDQFVEIISDPTGAKIEINNQYMGETPLKVRFTRQTVVDWVTSWGETKFVPSPFIIKAYPVQSGQYLQTKYIGSYDGIPTKLYFNMNLEPTTPTIKQEQDITIRN